MYKVAESRAPHASRPDWAGFSLFTVALASLIYALIESNQRSFTDSLVLGCFAAAAVLFTLPFPDDTFDDVTASLVLHYLQDWGPALAELRRVLKPGGRLIVSVDHPFAVNLMHREADRKPDYFATYNHTAQWTMGGQTAVMGFWHRPLHAMTDAFTAAGFRIAVISEPPPAPGARELFPDILADNQVFLCFIFFVLQAGRRRQARPQKAPGVV